MPINPFINNLGFNKYGYSDRMRRMFGGEKTFIDPYTSGYHFVYFFPPDTIGQEVGQFLTTVCQQVEIPGYTVNAITYNGLNNMKWNVPGTVELTGQQFTCHFTEMAGLPITQIMGRWVTIFRNVLYGISDPSAQNTYSQGAYKGKAVYATTLPDGLTVQFAAVFTGVFPGNIPLETIGQSNVMTHEKVELSIPFHFDQMLTGTAAEAYARTLVQATRSAGISLSDNIYAQETSSN